MNPNNQPQQPQTPQPSQQPQPTLQSPILSPTHFDAQPAPSSSTVQAAKPKDEGKKLSITAIVLGLVAVVGILLGVIGLVDSVATKDDLAAAEQVIATQATVIAKVESDTGTTITSVADVPDYVAIDGYIYIPEWSIKIGIPDNLHEVSYILDQKYRPQICFNGLEASVTNVFPAFADVDKNPGGMGCLTRVATSEGNSDSNGYSFGELVYTADDYNYFYSAPSGLYSQDSGEQGLEQTAIQIIKTMLTNNVSSY